MKITLVLSLLIIFMLSGCATRSISNSGYQNNSYYPRSSSNPFYKGELSEFNVLGIDPSNQYTEKAITQALEQSKEPLTLTKGEAILLIQSGALMPDAEMSKNMERYFAVSVFTGIPENPKNSNLNYSQSLRYSAAKAGIQKIIVYWGILESGVQNLATKTLSWVPIVGWGLPDENQQMRIRLKVALIDVKTGQWEIFSPVSFQDSAYSSQANRASSDQEQVFQLKNMAYESAVQAIINKYAK